MLQNFFKLIATPLITYQSRLLITHFTISNNFKKNFFTSSINGFLHIWNIKFQSPIYQNFYKNQHFVFVNINEKSNLLVTSSTNTQIILLKIKNSLKNENLSISTISKNVFGTLFTYLKFFDNNNLFLGGFRLIIWDIVNCKSKNLTSKTSKKIKKIIINKRYKNLVIYYLENQIYFNEFRHPLNLKKINLNKQITNLEWYSKFSNLILISTIKANIFLFDIRNLANPIQKISLKKIIPSINFFNFSQANKMLIASTGNIETIVIIGVKNFEFLKVYDINVRTILIKYEKISSQTWLSLNNYNNLILWRFFLNF